MARTKATTKQGDRIWAYLIHLGYNMWEDRKAPELMERLPHRAARPYLRCHKKLWDDVTQRLADTGSNMLLIDVADGIQYESHPEISVKRAWTRTQLKQELDRLRKLGLEPIPKLNFSTTHDAWLGPYAHMVSTDTYYAVCRDLIEEVIDLFDQPRFFHLGMDEETAQHQRYARYAVMRQYDLWWHDLKFYVKQVERQNVRAWVWSDYVWHHPDEFIKNMPRTVLQSNWYYGDRFGKKLERCSAFHLLDEHGSDQVPTGSNWSFADNMPQLARYCARHITPEHLYGFMQTPWHPTLNIYREHHLQAVDTLAEAKRIVK